MRRSDETLDQVALDKAVARFPFLIATAGRYGPDHVLVHDYAWERFPDIVEEYRREKSLGHR